MPRKRKINEPAGPSLKMSLRQKSKTSSAAVVSAAAQSEAGSFGSENEGSNARTECRDAAGNSTSFSTKKGTTSQTHSERLLRSSKVRKTLSKNSEVTSGPSRQRTQVIRENSADIAIQVSTSRSNTTET